MILVMACSELAILTQRSEARLLMMLERRFEWRILSTISISLELWATT